jgi:hypothetical protein
MKRLNPLSAAAAGIWELIFMFSQEMIGHVIKFLFSSRWRLMDLNVTEYVFTSENHILQMRKITIIIQAALQKLCHHLHKSGSVGLKKQ